jgi:multimeric flavodoxin WrbA
VNILAIAGSPRLDGNSTSLLNLSLDAAREQGHLVELMHAVQMNVRPCMACDACKRGDSCVVRDGMTEVYAGLDAADALVIATPIHSYTVSGWIKPVVDRCYALSDARGRSRLRKGKKLFVITSQGDTSPDDGLATVNNLGRGFAYCGFVLTGSLVATDVMDADDWTERPELQEAARHLLTDALGTAAVGSPGL